MRLSDEHFLQKSFPHYFTAISAALDEIVKRMEIDALLVFAPKLSEVGTRIEIPKVLDFADSDSLTIRRRIDNRGQSMNLVGRGRTTLQLVRQTGRERGLIRNYDLTTTISTDDRRALLRSARVSGDKVVILQNGVSEAALAAWNEAGCHERSLVFWGNMDFPPNWTAARYFFEEVFLPYLADQNIVWNIVGRGDAALRAALAHPNVKFHGYLPDLFAFASSQNVMINPMVEGSGLKNKVLEAFAIGLPVVSTSLGIEAVAGGKVGEHYFVADTPAEFSAKILELLEDDKLRRKMVRNGRLLVEDRYTWGKIGLEYCRLVERVIDRNNDCRLEETA
jgi:glycosyltransferase involved in cell wall biosynthesis